MLENFKDYHFEYTLDGSRFMQGIPATSLEDARARIAKLQTAEFWGASDLWEMTDEEAADIEQRVKASVHINISS